MGLVAVVTTPGIVRPAAVDPGSSPRDSVACAQASSRAAARARRSLPSAAPSTADRSRHAVGSETNRPEQLRLIAQYGQICDRLSAVGEHHRQIDRDPARIVPAIAAPQRLQCLAEPTGQPCDVGNVGQQPRTDMADHAATIVADHNPGTRSGTLHDAGAFLDGCF
jgi:hypothetical protein